MLGRTQADPPSHVYVELVDLSNDICNWLAYEAEYRLIFCSRSLSSAEQARVIGLATRRLRDLGSGCSEWWSDSDAPRNEEAVSDEGAGRRCRSTTDRLVSDHR